MMRVMLVSLVLGGCDPVWSLSIKVNSPAGTPLADTVLVLTGCPRQNEHDLGTLAKLTDASGEAEVGGTGTEYPPCRVTIAKPGYLTQQFTFDELCNNDRDDCERAQHKDVVLQPAP